MYRLRGSDFEFDKEAGAIIKYLGSEKDISIPSEISGITVTSIGKSAFASNKLTSVVIPNSVTSIGDRAFERNKLTNVIIPDSVKVIGSNAFYENTLKIILLPKNLDELGADTIPNVDEIFCNLDEKSGDYELEKVVETFIKLYQFTEVDEITAFEILAKYQDLKERYRELANHTDERLKNLGLYLIEHIEVSCILEKSEEEQLEFLQACINQDVIKKLLILFMVEINLLLGKKEVPMTYMEEKTLTGRKRTE